nr:hypothetical protein [Tanacetum cinerariifolium]
DDPIACLNKAMVFLTAVASSRAMLRVQKKILQVDRKELLNPITAKTADLDTYNSNCNDLSNAQGVLMANISNYGSDVILEDKANKELNNELITAEPKRYKERVNNFERLNIDLICREKMIDSQMNVMIKEKLALQEKMKPNLYDGIVIFEKHVPMPVIDDEETLILKEESRSKMFEKAKDPKVIAKKISHKPIDYENLNRLTDDFGKHFTPQQELSAEQAFWLRISNPSIESSLPLVRLEVPIELPKKRTTPNALTEGEWGFEYTKAVFNNEIIPFLKSLKNIFNVFNKDLLNEITEVKTVFDQIEAVVQQSSFDKQCLEIANKELLLENDRLSQQIMSQDIVYVVMKCMSLNVDCMNVGIQRSESCEKGIVEQAKAKQLLDNALDFPCKHAKRIQELLVYVQDTCPSAVKLSETKVARTPMNKFKKVTFAEPIAFSSTNQETRNSNKPMLHSTGVICSTSASGSTPSSNTKNNRISQPSSSDKINKVEDQPRSVKTRKNNKNHVKKVKCDDHVMQSMSNVNFFSVSINNAPVKNSVNDVKSGCLCSICGKCMIDETHHACVHLVVTKMNESQQSKSAKKHKKQNDWKPTGHVFTEVGLKWKPTSRTFTIFGNLCPLTRFTLTNIVPPKQPTSHSDEIQKPKIKVYSRKPKNVKKNISSSKMAKIAESNNVNHSEPNPT